MSMTTIKGTPLSGKNTLDVIIRKCDQLQLYPKIIIDKGGYCAFTVGNFTFYADSHSTGCNVMIWITLPNEPQRLILRTSYWYSSNYTFNSHQIEKGVWDEYLKTAINKMRVKVSEAELVSLEKKEAKQSESTDNAKKEKDEFSSKFLSAAG